MRKVKLIVDSSVSLTPELIKKYDIAVLRLHVRFDGDDKDYLDGQDINEEDIYKRVDAGSPLPKTSAASVGELIELFKKYIDQDYDIVYVGIGSTLSSNQQNATIASQEFEEGRIYLVDSRTLSSGSSLLLLKMAKYKEQGMSAREIYENVQPLAEKISAKFCIDKLDYLYKSGRCSGMAMLIGNVLHIHPVAKVINGKLVVYKKPRGPYQKAIDEQIEEFKRDLPNMDKEAVFITSGGRPNGWDQYILERISDYIEPQNIYVTLSGATIASHCGPQTLGILYILNKVEDEEE